MTRTWMIAAAIAIAACTAGCANTPWSSEGATGMTGSGASSYGSSDGAMTMDDPAGSATIGTGSVSIGAQGQEEVNSSGQGID